VGDISEALEAEQRLFIKSRRHVWNPAQCLQLGCKRKPAAVAVNVERLLAVRIPSQGQRAATEVRDRNGKHPIQPLKASLAQIFVQVKDYFDIAVCPETVPFFNQLATQLHIIVDLAIANDGNRFVFVKDGLLATRHIDDGEPRHADGDSATVKISPTVRAAMAQGIEHPSKKLWLRCVCVKPE
jgi:hypothetical protein